MLEEHFNGSEERNGREKRKRVGNVEERQDGSATTEFSSSENELTEILNETSVDEDGRICFYGTTSSFHLQPDKVLRPQPGERPNTVRTLGDNLPVAKSIYHHHERTASCVLCELRHSSGF